MKTYNTLIISEKIFKINSILFLNHEKIPKFATALSNRKINS